MAQVALDFELRFGDREPDVVAGLKLAAELVGERGAGQIRDVADHPCHAHPGVCSAPGGVVVAVLPAGIAQDRLSGDRVPGHALWLKGVRAGDRHDGVDLVRVQDRPLQRLHPPEGAAGHRRESLNAEGVQEGALRAHHVCDGDHRKVRTIGTAARRIDRRRSRRPATAAEQVGRDDEEASVSKALPGPIIPSHQPSPLARTPSRSSAANPSRVLSTGGISATPAAWASPLSAWQTRMTLSRAGERIP